MERAIEYNKKYTYEDILKIMSNVLKETQKQAKHKPVIYVHSIEEAERIKEAIKEFKELK